MVNKIIADYLKTNKRLVVPQFGAFLHKDDGTVAFVPFLKKDDGVLIRLIGSAYGLNPGDAQAAIEEFTAEIKKNIAAHGTYIIEGIGTLRIDSNGIYYLDSGQKAAQAAPARTPIAPAPVPPSATPAQQAPQRPAPTVEKPQPAVPQKPATEQRTAAAPQPQSGIPPRRSASQPMQQRPVQQQMPPRPGNPARQASPVPQQPYQPPMPNAGNRPPMNQPLQQPGYPRRPQQPGRPIQKRSKADGFIVIAIITAVIALAVMIFGFLVSREGPDIQSIILPAQTDTATVQSAPAPDND